jgi:hypothetical protein
MTTYTIAEQREGNGYDIQVVDDDGSTRELRITFGSQEEAERWVIADAQLSSSRVSGFRLLWCF